MRRVFRRMWVVTGLALLATMIVGEREARAAVSTGITITGGVKPGTGDPTIDYVFNVYLNPGSSFNEPYTSLSSLLHPDSFTIDGLVGVTPFSRTSQPLNQPRPPGGEIWVPSIQQTSSSPTVSSNVTWSFYGFKTITNSSTPNPGLFLGTFIVQTKNYPVGQLPTLPTTLDYSYTLGSGVTVNGKGSFQLTALTPEPASSTIVLLIGGSAALGGLIVRGRRRRLARTA